MEIGRQLATMQNVAHGGEMPARERRTGERRLDMAATTLFTCVCGTQKKTTNHWVLARVTAGGVTFMPWDFDLAMSRDIVVLCGEGCATALLSRAMTWTSHYALG